jgi:hypothetical protein
MDFVKLPDIDVYVASTTSIKEANEIAGAFFDLGIDHCFNRNEDSFQFVLEPDQYAKMKQLMQVEAIQVVEDALDDR